MNDRPKLHIGPKHITFIGNIGKTNLYHHAAVTLLIGLSGEIEVSTLGQSAQCRAVLIDANEPHTIDCKGQTMAAIFFEIDSNAAMILNTQLLPSSAFFTSFPTSHLLTKKSEQDLLEGRFDFLFPNLRDKTPNRELDSRITHCLELVRNKPDLSQQMLAERLNISASRLTHLFKSETGTPYRRYKLWTQLKCFVNDYTSTNSLASSAVHAGFYDSSHLCKTFNSLLGINPLRGLQNLSNSHAPSSPEQ